MNIQQFTFNPFQENTYVVYNDEKDALIIDPGCYAEEEEKALHLFITSNGLNVKMVVNTHLHIDHTFGNAFVEKTFHVKASANAADEFLIKDMDSQARIFGLTLRNAVTPLGGYLKEGDKITLGTDSFEIFQIPGHSPGSIVLYSAHNDSIFVGDVLFQGSIGRTDLQGGNYQSLIEGIQNKLLTLPEKTIVYCGHGPTTTIGHEKKNNPFL
jgi:Zn-dependent hydrolases, including glyoxylases